MKPTLTAMKSHEACLVPQETGLVGIQSCIRKILQLRQLLQLHQPHQLLHVHQKIQVIKKNLPSLIKKDHQKKVG
jgi:hypothetical protein